MKIHYFLFIAIVSCILTTSKTFAQTYNLNSGPSVCAANTGIDRTYNCASGSTPALVGTYTDTNVPGKQLSTMSIKIYIACNGTSKLFINGTEIGSVVTTGTTCSCQSIASTPGITKILDVTMTPAIIAAYVIGGSNSLTLSSTTGTQCFYGAEVAVTTSGTLASKWLDVYGNLNPRKQSTLTWRIQETNAASYNIEKSIDGRAFGKIGNVSSQGDGINNYEFTDPKSISNTCYYRINQIDKDGKISHSPVIKLTYQQNSSFAISPNPVTDMLTISAGASLLNTQAQITDLHGKIIDAFIITKPLFSLSMSHYASGLYLLRLQNGKTEKIIKQ